MGLDFSQNVSWKVYDIDGKLKDEGESHNTVTENCIQQIIDYLDGGSGTFQATHMGIADGGGSETASSTGLTSVTSSESVTVNSQSSTNGVTGDTANFTATFTATGTWSNIGSAGLFPQDPGATNANMLFVDTSISQSLTSGDTLQIDWAIDLS